MACAELDFCRPMARTLRFVTPFHGAAGASAQVVCHCGLVDSQVTVTSLH